MGLTIRVVLVGVDSGVLGTNISDILPELNLSKGEPLGLLIGSSSGVRGTPKEQGAFDMPESCDGYWDQPGCLSCGQFSKLNSSFISVCNWVHSTYDLVYLSESSSASSFPSVVDCDMLIG